jgi:signal transduction histidine kinase
MAFKIEARTILQLGAELISSDGVAFYELIKNAFDARTKKAVRIDIIVRVPEAKYRSLKESLKEAKFSSLASLRNAMAEALDSTAPSAGEFAQRIQVAQTVPQLQTMLEEANYIEVSDTGEGMSLQQLEDVYLTIGTRARLDQRDQSRNGKPILGEKGIGRLSAMRLGMRLRVLTSRTSERHWNILEIDWKEFGRAQHQLLTDIAIKPAQGEEKVDSAESGTTIHIADLNTEWSRQKLQNIAQQEFSRLMDPFSPPQVRMVFRFNQEPVVINPINKFLFEHADAYLEAEVKKISGEVGYELRGEIVYRLRKRRKALHLTQDHLLSAAGLSAVSELGSLGPFSMMCYWFNRRRLTAIEGIGDIKVVKALVDEWGGGLMLFRDGFRVHPYGGPTDDWLQLDPIAFKSQGYKVNRKQIIGKVDITNRHNPLLVDQTNREGLQDNLQSHALVLILQRILIDLRVFVTNVDDEIRQKEALDFDVLEERVEGAQSALEETLKQLVAKYPKERQIASSVRSVTEDIKEIMDQAKELAEGLDRRQNQLVHLAGIGLMVEIIAHELNRATQYTISLLASTELDNVPNDVQQTLETLESQLKTIQKRLRILDPLSTAGRQVKESFDLALWIREILSGHDPQFQRHGIMLRYRVIPATGEFRVRAVKGMIVQVFENLISNSVYWLKRSRIDRPSFQPEITVVVDCNNRQVRLSDNGPGVEPDQREEIFLPFVTTKPGREGKGLGLYIAREIAHYHGAQLYLSEKPTAHPRALNTFIFDLTPGDTK